MVFTEEELPKGSGDFILGYYSNNMNSIVGMTEPFQVNNTLLIILYLETKMHKEGLNEIKTCFETTYFVV